MDLKNKHLVHLAEGLLWAGVLLFFTKTGSEGIIYAAGTLEIFYAVFRFFLGYLPDAVSRVSRNKRNRERPGMSAAAVRASVLYGLLGTLLCMLTLLGLSFLADSLEISYMGRLLRIFLWITPFGCILQILTGILQTETGKTAVGVVRLIVSIGVIVGTVIGAAVLYPYGEKVGDFLQHSEVLYFYMALAVLPGIGLGILAACLYALAVILLHRYDFDCLHAVRDPKLPKAGGMLGMLFGQIGADSVLILLSRLPLIVLFFLTAKAGGEERILFGAFYGIILPLLMILQFLFDLGLTPIERGMVSAMRKRQDDYYYRFYIGAMKYVCLSGMTMAVLFAALHKPYLAQWNLQTTEALMSLALGCSVLFFISLLWRFLLDLLKLRGREKIILTAFIIGDASAVLSAAAFSGEAGMTAAVFVRSLALFYGISALVMLIFNEREIGTSPLTYLSQIWLPLLLTGAAGLLVFGMQLLLFTALGGFATTLLGYFVGFCLHLLSVGLTGAYSREELRIVPFGRVIGRFRGMKSI
ncbi:MAG: hypothetical protein LUE16_05265 [Lachnospiraceae bacterium]|nr:hypothetical protein [Lachnospiraceae bacterium]